MNLWTLAANYTNGIRTLRDWLGEGGIAVSPELAQSRANICLQCPCNTTQSLTETVGNAIREGLELKNELQLRVQGEKSLHTCSVCSCALRLKVHVPIDFIRKHKNQEEVFPSHCWQLTEGASQELHYAVTDENLKLFTNP